MVVVKGAALVVDDNGGGCFDRSGGGGGGGTLVGWRTAGVVFSFTLALADRPASGAKSEVIETSDTSGLLEMI